MPRTLAAMLLAALLAPFHAQARPDAGDATVVVVVRHAEKAADDPRDPSLSPAGEVRAQPSTPVSGWLTLCADSACKRRMASGKPRPLDAARGYEDVGIRLVRR